MTSIDDRIAKRLVHARVRARTIGRAVLVSVAERISAIDPLEVLGSMSHDGASGGTATDLTSDSMYWTRPADGFALAGLGTVMAFRPTGPNRFSTVDREWRSLLDDVLVDDMPNAVAGVGPLLMGGFAFDPDGSRAGRWDGFPSASLVVPRLQIAQVGDECWLTMTVLVGPDGQPDLAPAKLARLRRHVLAAPARVRQPQSAPANDGRLTMFDVLPAPEWRAMIATAVAAIRSGAMEKVVLAREVRAMAPSDLDVVAILRQLRSAHPGSSVFGCWRGNAAFVGASPERLVRIDGNVVRASSVAGSVRRGTTPTVDAALSAGLLSSAKDRWEHEVVRRALCAGLAELCDDVVAPAEPSLLSLPNVHHLHTPVQARLRPEHSLLDLVARLHPTPAVAGAPHDVALRFMREHERLDRGWYAGPVGWLQRDCGEFAVALRSALVRGAEASLFAGCGVVADSDPDEEYAESLLKLLPMQQALISTLAASDTGSPMDAPAIAEVVQ